MVYGRAIPESIEPYVELYNLISMTCIYDVWLFLPVLRTKLRSLYSTKWLTIAKRNAVPRFDQAANRETCAQHFAGSRLHPRPNDSYPFKSQHQNTLPQHSCLMGQARTQSPCLAFRNEGPALAMKCWSKHRLVARTVINDTISRHHFCSSW